MKISQQSVLRRFITAGLWTSGFYSVLRTMYWDVLLHSCETMTRNGILLYLFTCIREKHPTKMEISWVGMISRKLDLPFEFHVVCDMHVMCRITKIE